MPQKNLTNHPQSEISIQSDKAHPQQGSFGTLNRSAVLRMAGISGGVVYYLIIIIYYYYLHACIASGIPS